MSLCFVRLVPPRYIVSPSSEIYMYIYIYRIIHCSLRVGSRSKNPDLRGFDSVRSLREKDREGERERETERERFLTLVGWNSWVLRRSSRANLSRETGRNADPA